MQYKVKYYYYSVYMEKVATEIELADLIKNPYVDIISVKEV